MKRHLTSKVMGSRGGHVFHAILASIEKMSEEEAREWYWLLQNIEEDSRREGTRRGAREPWRYGA